ncbi:hypothetical protein D0859_00842 [Hortaea werneckii]|uniref:Uncharacterized protein n=1 Tax=Hortaea werneckii TaxID=91943 RepID=A0A3M7JB21_HORWE|nr:hypothetical protein D0859_00842 [Hortaea werneckii]
MLPSQTATALPADPASSSDADPSDPNASPDDSSENNSQAETATLEASNPGNSGSYQAQPTKSDAKDLTSKETGGSSNEAPQTGAASTPSTTNALSILQSAMSSATASEDPEIVTSSFSTEPSVVNSHVGGNDAVGLDSTVSQHRESSVILGTQGAHPTPSSTPSAGHFAQSSAAEVSTTAGHQQETVLTIGSVKFTASANSDGAVLQNEEETATLSAEGVEVTFAGEAVSLDPQGQLAVGSSTYAVLPQDPASAATAISIDGQIYYPNAVSGKTNAFEVAGNTLSVGGPAKTLDNGHVFSAANGVLLIDSTSSIPIAQGATAAPSTQSIPTLVTIGGSEFTASGVSGRPSEIVIESHTLSAGGLAATINGHTISQASDGAIVADGTTLKMPSKTLDGASTKGTDASTLRGSSPSTAATASRTIDTVQHDSIPKFWVDQ